MNNDYTNQYIHLSIKIEIFIWTDVIFFYKETVANLSISENIS